MRAHLGYNQLSKKQLKLAQDVAHEQFRSEAKDYTRRMMKIFCLAMNKKRGHGKIRLTEDLETITQIVDEHMYDEVFWYHADKRLEQIGVPFEPEDYDKMEVR